MPLRIYGFLVSQPTRAVDWVLRLKGVDYELVDFDPHDPDWPDEFRQLSPTGLVPLLKDRDFSLAEGAAILLYLAEKHGWTDLFPVDIKQRAKINEYLHWHHTNMRKATPDILYSFIHRSRGVATANELAIIKNKHEIIAKFISVFENMIVGPFIAGTKEPTIADFFGCTEIYQLVPMFDFSKYPKVHGWLMRMKQVPLHDELHKDISDFVDSLDVNTT